MSVSLNVRPIGTRFGLRVWLSILVVFAGSEGSLVGEAHATQQATPVAEVAPAAPISALDIVTSNLEPSYFAPFPLVIPVGTSTPDPLWFEVNVAPHFLVARPSWPVAFDLVPKILLRMYRENSAPVRTPSYMPRLTAYVLFSREFDGRPLLYSSLTVGHHSNGQSGPFFNKDGSFNHDSGDFATNSLEAALYVTGGRSDGIWWVSPSLEWHPTLGETEELKGRYGFWRAHVAFAGLKRLLLDDKLYLTLSATLDGLDIPSDRAAARILRRFPTSARYVVKFPGLDLGVYLGAYVGPDYYNIWFDRVVTAFQIGISGDARPTYADEPRSTSSP